MAQARPPARTRTRSANGRRSRGRAERGRLDNHGRSRNPSTATVYPVVSSTPLCASPSTPRASPLTTTTPAWAIRLERESRLRAPGWTPGGRVTVSTFAHFSLSSSTKEVRPCAVVCGNDPFRSKWAQARPRKDDRSETGGRGPRQIRLLHDTQRPRRDPVACAFRRKANHAPKSGVARVGTFARPNEACDLNPVAVRFGPVVRGRSLIASTTAAADARFGRHQHRSPAPIRPCASV
jgi:hypothetical protein